MKFSDFQLLAWRLNKFFMSFFKSQVSFPLNFASHFSVMTHNSSENFQLKHYMLWTKIAISVQFFRLLGALMKVHPIPHTIFETTTSGFIQILHHCSLSWKITPLYFLAQNHILLTKIAHWSEVFGLLSGSLKIQFFFKFCITFQFHDR